MLFYENKGHITVSFMTLLIKDWHYAYTTNTDFKLIFILQFNCWETSKWRGDSMSDFLKVCPLFKGVHYVLGFPLPVPTNQGSRVFKGVYSRKHGTCPTTSAFSCVGWFRTVTGSCQNGPKLGLFAYQLLLSTTILI